MPHQRLQRNLGGLLPQLFETCIRACKGAYNRVRTLKTPFTGNAQYCRVQRVSAAETNENSFVAGVIDGLSTPQSPRAFCTQLQPKHLRYSFAPTGAPRTVSLVSRKKLVGGQSTRHQARHAKSGHQRQGQYFNSGWILHAQCVCRVGALVLP